MSRTVYGSAALARPLGTRTDNKGELMVMKKPVRLTKEQLTAKADKVKDRNIEFGKNISPGSVNDFLDAAKSFAESKDCLSGDVRISLSWGRPYMTVKRPETPEEKLARLRIEENNRFRYKMNDYQLEQRRLKRNAEYARQELAKSTFRSCCPGDCCCRRGGCR